jgi:hypothetical protein
LFEIELSARGIDVGLSVVPVISIIYITVFGICCALCYLLLYFCFKSLLSIDIWIEFSISLVCFSLLLWSGGYWANFTISPYIYPLCAYVFCFIQFLIHLKQIFPALFVNELHVVEENYDLDMNTIASQEKKADG